MYPDKITVEEMARKSSNVWPIVDQSLFNALVIVAHFRLRLMPADK
jgi:hypothetical protein